MSGVSLDFRQSISIQRMAIFEDWPDKARPRHEHSGTTAIGPLKREHHHFKRPFTELLNVPN